jgi:hypothetical protein
VRGRAPSEVQHRPRGHRRGARRGRGGAGGRRRPAPEDVVCSEEERRDAIDNNILCVRIGN